jgi:hypothetical protein
MLSMHVIISPHLLHAHKNGSRSTSEERRSVETCDPTTLKMYKALITAWGSADTCIAPVLPVLIPALAEDARLGLRCTAADMIGEVMRLHRLGSSVHKRGPNLTATAFKADSAPSRAMRMAVATWSSTGNSVLAIAATAAEIEGSVVRPEGGVPPLAPAAL